MAIDLDEVFGVAVADFIKRFLALWSCLAVGVLLVATAGVLMTFLWSLWMYFNGGGFTMIDMPDPMALIVGLLIGYIFPLFSSWGPLYGAILLGLIIYFFRADAPHAVDVARR